MINLRKESGKSRRCRIYDLSKREIDQMLESYKRTVTFFGYTNVYGEQV